MSDKQPRLWCVRLEKEIVVLAADTDEACRVAEDCVDGDDGVYDMSATPVRSLTDLPVEWDGNCLPWGIPRDPQERTCREILEGADEHQ